MQISNTPLFIKYSVCFSPSFAKLPISLIAGKYKMPCENVAHLNNTDIISPSINRSILALESFVKGHKAHKISDNTFNF